MVTGRRRRPDRHGVRASDTTYLRSGGRQDAKRIKRTVYPKVKLVEAYQRITSFLGVLYHILKSLATKRAADPPKSAGERRKEGVCKSGGGAEEASLQPAGAGGVHWDLGKLDE